MSRRDGRATHLSPHRICEVTGETELWCDHCDQLAFGRRTVTPAHRADRDPGTSWLSDHADKRLQQELRDLPERLAVAVAVIDGERLGSGGVRTVPGSRPPLNIAVLDLTLRAPLTADPMAHTLGARGAVLSGLESWVRLAHDEMLDTDTPTTDPDPTPTVTSETGWLLRHITWILDQQWVVELAEDVHRWAEQIRESLGDRAEYRPRCPKCGDWVAQFAGFFTCPSGHETPARHLMALQHPMTADQFAEAFDVTPAAIRQWVKRGHLAPAVDDEGKVLTSGKAHRYHVTDVLALVDSAPRVG